MAAFLETGLVRRPARRRRTLAAALAAAVLAGCATQAPYTAPTLQAPAAWSLPAPAPETGELPTPRDTWWTALHDPAIDTLTRAALAESPTLAQAVARVAEARAALGSSAAQQLPSLSATADAARARSTPLGTGSPPAAAFASTGSAGLALSWEIDLFGRVRSGVETARRRLDARHADAEGTRLSLAAQVGDTVLALRACEFSRGVLADDIASRETTLQLTRRRLAAGLVAPVEEARALSGLASAHTTLALQQQACSSHLNALVALTGQQRSAVRAQLATPFSTPVDGDSAAARSMPAAPTASLALPARVLASHPHVVAAEREAAAAWAEIAVARAERLPRLDLAALLTGQWLYAAGSTQSGRDASLAASLAAPLFDGGRGAAGVDAAEARYRAALAGVHAAVRLAAQEVENALAGIASAETRRATTALAVQAARLTLSATEAMWRAGSVSLFELEDARRAWASAEDSAIAAARDSGQGWIALVLASGNAALPASTTPISPPTS